MPAAELAQIGRLGSGHADQAVGVGEVCREHAELRLEVGLLGEKWGRMLRSRRGRKGERGRVGNAQAAGL